MILQRFDFPEVIKQALRQQWLICGRQRISVSGQADGAPPHRSRIVVEQSTMTACLRIKQSS